MKGLKEAFVPEDEENNIKPVRSSLKTLGRKNGLKVNSKIKAIAVSLKSIKSGKKRV